MIRIKAVDEQNISEVCKLTTSQDGICTAANGCSCCNAISIAEAKYDSQLHPNAIYNNNTLIGFFMYKRSENQAEKATIRRFMIDDKFQHKDLEEKALEHILRGLKIQGVKKVVLMTDNANENAKKLYISFGFHFIGRDNKTECCYETAL